MPERNTVTEFGTMYLTPELIAGKSILIIGGNDAIEQHCRLHRPASVVTINDRFDVRADYLIWDIQTRELPHQNWDIIVCTEVLQRTLDWRNAIDNITKSLAGNGWLLLTTRSLGNPIEDFTRPDHWRFNRMWLEQVMAHHGFELTVSVDDHYTSPGVLMFLKRIREIGGFGCPDMPMEPPNRIARPTMGQP